MNKAYPCLIEKIKIYNGCMIRLKIDKLRSRHLQFHSSAQFTTNIDICYFKNSRSNFSF